MNRRDLIGEPRLAVIERVDAQDGRIPAARVARLVADGPLGIHIGDSPPGGKVISDVVAILDDVEMERTRRLRGQPAARRRTMARADDQRRE